MSKNKAVTLSLSEFVNVIKTLEIGQYIYQHQRDSSSTEEYIQLPFDVTCGFIKLDRSLHSPEWNFLKPKKEFDNFFHHLVRFARFNNGGYPTAEKAHAEYLLGFLLHHNIQIKIDDNIFSIEAALEKYQPPRYSRVYFYKGELISPEVSPTYQFLSEQWRQDQSYPELEKLSQLWVAHIHSIEQERIAKEQAELAKRQQEEQERIAKEQLRAQYAAYKAAHFFEDNILDLKLFSLVLEGFIKTGRILLANDNNPWVNKPRLPADISALILQFSQLSRSPSNPFIPNNESTFAFIRMMKAIISTAKYQGNYLNASHQLLGFLLYHNFQINHQGQLFRISDIVQAEMTQEDYNLLSVYGEMLFPFLNGEWRQSQGYPGKDQLEKLLNDNQSYPVQPQQTYLPGFQQRAMPSFLPTNTWAVQPQNTVRNPFEIPRLW
ncbi:MAG: hypothetical protein HYX61_05220 [Gammaproteobacteria bacterium]|nr:hypothetical protein [Gammaproteobacteria bacterium]